MDLKVSVGAIYFVFGHHEYWLSIDIYVLTWIALSVLIFISFIQFRKSYAPVFTSLYIYNANALVFSRIKSEVTLESLRLKSNATGARLTKAYDITMQRYRNSHAKIENSKMHI